MFFIYLVIIERDKSRTLNAVTMAVTGALGGLIHLPLMQPI